MDKVRFSCPRCQSILQTGAEKIGYDVACPHCGHRFRLVESGEETSVSSPTARGQEDVTIPPSNRPPVPESSASQPTSSYAPGVKPPSYQPANSRNYGQAPVIGRAPAAGHQPGFTCPYCGTHSPPQWKSEVSTIGWIVFAILLVTTCVFCFVGLFIRDKYRVCSKCRIRLG